MDTNLITVENSTNVLKEIEDAFYDIPFENSQFQTECFVIAAQITPERAYRAIGLRMHAKLRALTEAQYAAEMQQVELDEIEYKLESCGLNQFDRRREEIKRNKILSEQVWTNKLINDAICELNVLYKHFKSLPRYTREQFEAGERNHYEQRLTRAVHRVEGAAESLVNMHDDFPALTQYESAVMRLQGNVSEDTLNQLRLQMTNQLPLESKPG